MKKRLSLCDGVCSQRMCLLCKVYIPTINEGTQYFMVLSIASRTRMVSGR